MDLSEQAVAEAPPTEEQAAASAQLEEPAALGESVEFTIVFGKQNTSVSRPIESTIGQLKADVEQKIGIPAANQKLLCGGKALKEDSVTLKQAGVKKGSKVMLLGSVPAAVQSVIPQAGGTEDKWDNEVAPSEPLHKQKQHAKVLEKGLPEDALPSIKDRQIPLAQEVKGIPGLLNSQGVKVRLTFKDELQQLWLASATTTQKVPYSTISKIEAFPIEGKEEYSIMALHLGSGTTSKYWLYFVPSQHVAAIKIRILGVESLL